MAKTKAHAKRKEPRKAGAGECDDKTMCYYTQHYQDDNVQGETCTDNGNEINAMPNQGKAHTTMQDEMDKEETVELPDWRTSCSFRQQRSPAHHEQDLTPYGESPLDGKPPVIVYCRKRKKKPISINVTPADLSHPYTAPNSSASPCASTTRSRKRGRKKTSRSKQQVQVKSRLQFKAGHMKLRKTTSRVKRSQASGNHENTAALKCKFSQTPSTSRVQALRKRKPPLERESPDMILPNRLPKVARNNTNSLPKRQRKKCCRLSSLFSRIQTSDTSVRDEEKGTCNQRDDKISTSLSAAKTKRKKHRPKVQGERQKASFKAAQDANKSRKPRGRPPKVGGSKANQKLAKPTKNIKKRIYKKRKTLPSQMENLLGSGGFVVVHGCPEVLNIIPCSCHKDEVKALPALQSTKEAQLILCLHDPSKAKEITPVEASSSASNEVCQQVSAENSQLALTQEHHPPPPNTSSQIVLYDERREIILFKVSKELKRVRPKVPISAENERIWPLLALGGIPTDYEDPQYWEKERDLMNERVKDFILRMHGVQGDRRFSPWKGSVLDSVVGAFLTQNVLDHFSSSAFMSIASRFPAHNREHTNKPTREASHPIQTNCAADFCAKKEEDSAASPSQDNMVKRSSKPQSTPAALNSLKKRRLSHISGIERAYIEENLNGWKKNSSRDWESMRKQTLNNPSRHDKRMPLHENSVDWEAVRHGKVEDLAKAIKERGMHHVLSGRIKAFLKALDEEHGSIDLEWLRELSPENARAYLMSIHGLNVKSTECIRLLTLHHVAFPVDVHVGRICVRLGWVPIEPLPEQLQLHLLELYPLQETVQKYLWPRLCTLDPKTLYEFHYQLITFGKVFCTKSKPNCNACPMQKGCKHFASAYASAKLLLTRPTSKEKAHQGRDDFTTVPLTLKMEDNVVDVFPFEDGHFLGQNQVLSSSALEIHDYEENHELMDMEDFPYIYKDQTNFAKESSTFANLLVDDDPQFICPLLSKHDDGGSTSGGCLMSHVTKDSNACYSENFSNKTDYKEVPSSKRRLVFEEASTKAVMSIQTKRHINVPQLKKATRSCTIHYVYEIPDMHPLLLEVEPRRKDDPSSYLLAIWSPDEVPHSKQNLEKLCDSCPTLGGDPNEIVPGTLLIPCKTALRGSFPLNGTYFQVNEVFADHESSLQPFQVPRALIWELHRCLVYFGTSLTQIVRGFTRDEIKECFSNGYVCVRGFDRCSRAPKPLVCRLHLCESREQTKKSTRWKTDRANFDVKPTR